MTTSHPATPLQALSRLLDQALELPPEQVEAWLCSLGADDRLLVPRLRSLLAKHQSGTCAAFMSSSPRLDEPADAVSDQAGDSVGPYRLLREVGRGGMSTVWLAQRADVGSQAVLALKLPHPKRGESLSRRAASERDITALMRHPNVARCHDAGSDPLDRPYLVLDYVAGQPLDAFCATQQLDVDGRLRLFLQLARAVAYVHGLGVVHRDLKPANVLVNESGQVQLIDFGIACRLPGAHGSPPAPDSERSFTASYASPEQLRGQAPSFSSDVYSLGVVLFELLTGRLPHQRRRGLLAAVDGEAPGAAPPWASCTAQDPFTAWRLQGQIDAILAKALAPEPAQRYTSASALARAIEQHLRHTAPALPGPARLAGSTARLARSNNDRLVAFNDSTVTRARHSAAWPGSNRRPPLATGQTNPPHAAAGRQKET